MVRSLFLSLCVSVCKNLLKYFENSIFNAQNRQFHTDHIAMSMSMVENLKTFWFGSYFIPVLNMRTTKYSETCPSSHCYTSHHINICIHTHTLFGIEWEQAKHELCRSKYTHIHLRTLTPNDTNMNTSPPAVQSLLPLPIIIGFVITTSLVHTHTRTCVLAEKRTTRKPSNMEKWQHNCRSVLGRSLFRFDSGVLHKNRPFCTMASAPTS